MQYPTHPAIEKSFYLELEEGVQVILVGKIRSKKNTFPLLYP